MSAPTVKISAQLYLAKKTKPLAMTAKDGTFVVQLLAYSRCASAGVTPWRLVYAGDKAMAFWREHAPCLIPGTVLAVQAFDPIIVEGGGRHAGAEIYARVASLDVVPKPGKDEPYFYTKTSCSVHSVCAASY